MARGGKTRLPTTAKKVSARKTSRSSGLPAKGTDARFQAESDVHTLQRAAEVKSDPKRFSNAKKLAAVQAQQLKKLTK